MGSRVAARALAGAALGCLLLAGLVFLGDAEPESAPLAAAAGAVATALLPRIGWIASALALCGWLATAGGRPGSALVVLVAVLAVPILLPRAGLLWSLPVAAPLLGALGLAPAFVGLAALAPTAWRRAGLAAAGLIWLFGAEALTGEALLFGVPDAVPAPASWEGSLTEAAQDVIGPIVSSPQTTALVVWAGLRGGAPAAAARPLAGDGLRRRGALGGGPDGGARRGRGPDRRRSGAGAGSGGGGRRARGGRGGGGDLAIGPPSGGMARPARDHRLGLPSART